MAFILTVWSALRVLRRQFGDARRDDVLPGRKLVVGATAVDLAFIVATALLLSNATASANGSSMGFQLALALPVVAVVLAGVAAVVAIRQWIEHRGMPASRLRYTAVVIVALLFTWSLTRFGFARLPTHTDEHRGIGGGALSRRDPRAWAWVET